MQEGALAVVSVSKNPNPAEVLLAEHQALIDFRVQGFDASFRLLKQLSIKLLTNDLSVLNPVAISDPSSNWSLVPAVSNVANGKFGWSKFISWGMEAPVRIICASW
jgi:hypothetical protein